MEVEEIFARMIGFLHSSYIRSYFFLFFGASAWELGLDYSKSNMQINCPIETSNILSAKPFMKKTSNKAFKIAFLFRLLLKPSLFCLELRLFVVTLPFGLFEIKSSFLYKPFGFCLQYIRASLYD